jgi:LmbE family N-acetylglucosaminyl deacetylase
MLNGPYQRVYLSPHLDDAALSCGGRIYQERRAGLPVLVVTVMAGDPPLEAMDVSFVAALHTRWELDSHSNPVAARRAEDREALSILDAAGLYWEWPDCIYRRHSQTGDLMYQSEATLFGPVHPAEKALIEELARRLTDLPLASGGQVYAPLTVGGHVDHRLVRHAAEMWGPPQGKLVYYEDYPYVERSEALAMVLGDGSGWWAQVIPLDGQALTVKAAAVACYRSQLSTFFASEAEITRRLQAYAAVAGGGNGWAERYWHRKTRSDN